MDSGHDIAMPEAVDDVLRLGYHILPEPVDRTKAEALLAAIKSDRDFGAGLFMDEASFVANPQYKGVNPRPGRNRLEALQDHLGFVEQAPQVVAALQALLGEGYEILDRKLVCGVPRSVIPDWVRARVEGDLVNNLGAYVRPEYRDITYFYGIDFHQDLIDYKDRDAEFITLYCYLHPVTVHDAPLFLLEGSHHLGATVFPHDLTRTGETRWRYGDRRGNEIEVGQKVLIGDTGFVGLWHACTLHGTQPDAADHERISLRYLLARKNAAPCYIDQINEALAGPIRLPGTRLDLAGDGSPTLKGNIVNQV